MATEFAVVKDRAYSALSVALTIGASTLTVTAGEGALFPSTFPFYVSLDAVASREIVKVTNRSTDVLTITRAQLGTSAAVHALGAVVSLNVLAQHITDLNNAVNTLEADSPTDLFTGTGDMLYSSAPGVGARLAIGNGDDILSVQGGLPVWRSPVNILTDLSGQAGASFSWNNQNLTSVGAVNGLTLTAQAVGFTVAGGTTSKTLTVSNTLTLAGTDSSTLNVGAGGTLGSAAFTAATAYEAAGGIATHAAVTTGIHGLDAKAPLASPTFTGTVTIPSLLMSGGLLNRTVDNSYLWIIGASGSGLTGAGAELVLYGKSQASAGAVDLYTPDAAGTGSVKRLSISGVLTTAVATWASITHTGIVLSGDLNINSQALTNAANIKFRTATSYGIWGESIELNNANTAGGIAVNSWNDTNTRSLLSFYRSGSDTIGAYTAVPTANITGEIGFFGADGTDWQPSAYIRALTAGTIGANRVPGQLDFHIYSDVAASTDLTILSMSASNITLSTSDAAQTAKVDRLSISGALATAVATWSDVTHTGLVLTGGAILAGHAPLASPTFTGTVTVGLSVNGTGTTNYVNYRGGTDTAGDAAVLALAGKSHSELGSAAIYTPSASGGVDLVRLKITGVVSTAVATWSAVNHVFGSGTITSAGASDSTHISLSNSSSNAANILLKLQSVQDAGTLINALNSSSRTTFNISRRGEVIHTYQVASRNSVTALMYLGADSTDQGIGQDGIGVGLIMRAWTSGSAFASILTINAVIATQPSTFRADLIIGATTVANLTLKGLTLVNSVDSVGVADEVTLGSYDLSADNRTLALSTERAVAADIGLASTHSLTVRINGANYKVMLVSA